MYKLRFCRALIYNSWFWLHGSSLSFMLNLSSLAIGLGVLWACSKPPSSFPNGVRFLYADLRIIYAAMLFLSAASFYLFKLKEMSLHPYQATMWSCLPILQTVLIIASHAVMTSVQEDLELLDKSKYAQKGA